MHVHSTLYNSQAPRHSIRYIYIGHSLTFGSLKPQHVTPELLGIVHVLIVWNSKAPVHVLRFEY